MNQGMTLGFGQTAVHGTSRGGKAVSRNRRLLMAMTKKSVLSKMPICHTAAKQTGLLRNAQTRKDLSVVQQYVQVKHKAIDFILQSLCWSPDDVPAIQDEPECSSYDCTPNCDPGWEKFDGKCYLWSQEKLFWAAAELKCRSINSHLTSVTTKKIHDYLKQDVSENYVFMKSLNIAGEDPIWYLDWRNRPIPRG